MNSSYQSPSPRRGFASPVALLSGIAGLLIVCGALFIIFNAVRGNDGPDTPATPTAASNVLVIAYSPEKATLFGQLIDAFNRTRPRATDGTALRVEGMTLNVEQMLAEAVRDSRFQAISPDSSLWFGPLEASWQETTGSDVPLVGATYRYAITPLVIAAWEEVARELGWPDRAVGWEEVLTKANADANFRWSHPSTSSASGLLATLATFYAGADKTRGLTKEDALSQATLNYVGAIEKTVRFYGEGDLGIIAQVQQEGRRALDAFVIPEQMVIQYNQGRPAERLVAIYPKEGALWADHPLALLEKDTLTADQRLAFQQFREYLLSADAQALVLRAGYRPADLNIPLTGPDSPISEAMGVNPSEPQTTLQVPAPDVVEVVRNAWLYTKRNANIFLVVDTSGSMEGERIEAVREALLTFLDQIQVDRERVGMVEFNTRVTSIIPLATLSENRMDLQAAVERLRAGGDTALLDGVRAAYVRLQDLGDRERINAIVALTDGQENASNVTLNDLTTLMRRENERGVPVIVFSIAFGNEGDLRALDALAEATGGQMRRADPETISDLYRILSQYF